jgi:precorrin-2 dehydrogenase/sirohydrochlorin ferrochelatase
MVDGWARRFRVLNNSVDDPAASAIIFPAIYRAGSLNIAISTQGQAPALARKIKREIAQTYGSDYGSYLQRLGELRETIQQIETRFDRRKLLMNHLLSLDRERVVSADLDALKEMLRNGTLINRD